jgi:hypothetical protein
MKRSHFWILTALLVVSCGGDDGAGPVDDGGNNTTDPTPTTPGTPNGAPTTQSIGPAGGTITSADGLFSITIPPGALTSLAATAPALETEITIQPITNTAWGGVGSGYRLLPDGVEFAVPVELNFSLEDSMLWGSDTSLVDVARQKDDGVWGILKSRRIDWESRTLTCTTSHFSDYSMVEGMQIRPPAASVAPLGTVNLFVRYCERQTVSGGAGNDDLTALILGCDGSMPPNTVSNWSVNGLPGGNATIGTVVQTAPGKARYTAPTTEPQDNPVAVSVNFISSRGNGVLVSNITIGGVWYGTVTITQGTYKSEASVIWTEIGVYQGLETYRPSGTVHYSPDTDYGPVCWFVSMDPRDGNVVHDDGVLFIDWNNVPAKAFGYGTTQTTSTTCFSCDGWDQPECNTDVLPGWFSADSLAVDTNGDAISWTYTDYDALPPRTMTVDFKKGLPPVPFMAKQ